MAVVGNIAIVSGAARGLGRAYALRLARLGVDVAIVDIDLDAARKTGEKLEHDSVMAEIEALGCRSIGIEGDLSDRATAESAVAEVVAKLGNPQILVNNAGGMIVPVQTSTATTSSLEDAKKLFDVNFWSMYHLCQAVVPAMREAGSGAIVNTSSQTAVSVYPGGAMAAYAAAKAAVTQFTRYLAAEVGQWNIRANCLAPGIILTSRVAMEAAQRGVGTGEQAKQIPLRRLGQTDDCAGVMEFLVSDLSQYVTGQCICVDGGAVMTPS
jgi:NAD(P)-dependent dehydrogenase (short-subunit alcohol dehydrogenase family)